MGSASIPQPISQLVPRPADYYVSPPIAQLIPQSVPQATQPVVQPVQSIVQSIVQPVVQPVVHPTQPLQPIPQPVVQPIHSIVQPSIQPITQPTAQQPTPTIIPSQDMIDMINDQPAVKLQEIESEIRLMKDTLSEETLEMALRQLSAIANNIVTPLSSHHS